MPLHSIWYSYIRTKPLCIVNIIAYMLISHRIALDPNNRQATHFAQAAGVARFAYGWALDEWKRQYEARKSNNKLPRPSAVGLINQLNAIKKDSYPWMYDVSCTIPTQAIFHLEDAFKHFFAKRSKYPRYKKKYRDDRFTIANRYIHTDGKYIYVPKLGKVRMRESLRFTGKLMSATFSRVAGRWYVSLTVDIPQPIPLPRPKSHGVVGVDLGVTSLATLSTGEVVQGPKPLAKFLSLLRLRNKAVSRKQRGSANRLKAVFRRARLYARIANIRNDAIHKLTTDLVRRFHTICIEDLNVSGMMTNRSLARHISDMGFRELRRQLEYKAAMYGRRLVVADRYFPSSKLCSACGHKVDTLPLHVRTWLCPNCGTIHHRDLNAARNLERYASLPTASSAGSQACGEEGSGHMLPYVVKPASVKQEPSTQEG